MIYAVDVGYYDNFAKVACIGFKDWRDKNISYQKIDFLENIAPYQAGQFYKRELPCLLKVLSNLDDIDYIIVDGFVWLEKPDNSGLGGHLYKILQKPVIGVAKNRFKSTPKECEVFRGKSRKPLYVTSIGISLDKAKEHIKNMYGEHRIPLLLKKSDTLSRNI